MLTWMFLVVLPGGRLAAVDDDDSKFRVGTPIRNPYRKPNKDRLRED